MSNLSPVHKKYTPKNQAAVNNFGQRWQKTG